MNRDRQFHDVAQFDLFETRDPHCCPTIPVNASASRVRFHDAGQRATPLILLLMAMYVSTSVAGLCSWYYLLPLAAQDAEFMSNLLLEFK